MAERQIGERSTGAGPSFSASALLHHHAQFRFDSHSTNNADLPLLNSLPYLIIPGRTVAARRPETMYRLAKVGSVLCVCVCVCDVV